MNLLHSIVLQWTRNASIYLHVVANLGILGINLIATVQLQVKLTVQTKVSSSLIYRLGYSNLMASLMVIPAARRVGMAEPGASTHIPSKATKIHHTNHGDGNRSRGIPSVSATWKSTSLRNKKLTDAAVTNPLTVSG